jgi:hypothetical protein
MLRTLTHSLLFSTALGVAAAACSAETIVDLTVTQTVEIDFHEMTGNVPAQTLAGEIVFDLRAEPDFAELEDRLRCVGLDPYESVLHVSRLEAEGLESFLDFRVDIAPYPDGAWTPLADFASLVTDQSTRGFDDAGFKIYLEGLDVLEAAAFDATPQYELRVSSKVPNDVLDLEVRLDLTVIFSSQAGACPSP